MTGKRVVQSSSPGLSIDDKLIFDWAPIRDVDGLKIKLKARGEKGEFLRANSGPPPWHNSVTHHVPATDGVIKFWTLWDVVPVEATEVASDPWSTTTPSTIGDLSDEQVLNGDEAQPSRPGAFVGTKSFTYQQLLHATNHFSHDNFLGEGAFGSVCKGFLPGVGVVAIKRLKPGSTQGESEFHAEINVIGHVHQRNLVSLVGYCISKSERLLVYEYLENGALSDHLRGIKKPVLDWPTRMRIALGAAKGLAYLHEECEPRIIHRDIKAANILLDSNFRAKVADFGLAKFFPDNQSQVFTTTIKGSFGYLDPDLFSSGRLTDKADVYSFGVVLLELITGRKPTTLVGWASPFLYQALEDGMFETELIDPKLEDNYDYEEMNCMVACAAVSVLRFPDNRPRMSQVVQVLEGNISIEKLKAITSKPRKRRST